MEKIKILPAREEIALAIKNAILAGEITAGTELIQERIAEMLGVSRMPIREAFLILERDRFIELVNGRKAIVREFSEADVIEHYELRALLEGETARKAAAAKADVTKLGLYLSNMESAKNASVFLTQNKLFHEEIWELSKGKRIKDFIGMLWTHIPPVVMKNDHMSLIEHAEIFRAIQAGDSELAYKTMRQHILRSMNDYLTQKGISE